MRPFPRFAQGVVLVAGLAVLSCGPEGTLSTSPDSGTPSQELVDPGLRLDEKEVNAHTYGSFVIPIAGGATAILSGPANFPGNPPGGPGTCVSGLWINSKGKPTAGTIDHPHPHCVTTGMAMTIVLEPISSRTRNPLEKCPADGICDFLYFDSSKSIDLNVFYQPGSVRGVGSATVGEGRFEAYAIDAATLNRANVRVGTLVIDLTQYNEPLTNLFGSCTLDTDEVQCLPRIITAIYIPLAVGGVGETMQVTGFLWWTPASAPYNY